MNDTDTYSLSLKDWFTATHPWSFVMTFFPTLFAILFAVLKQPQFEKRWPLGLLAVVGSVIYQAGSNLLSDYSDYKKGVDKAGEIFGNNSLTSRRFKTGQILNFGRVMILLGIILGLYLVGQSGLPLLWIGLLGTIAAVYYRIFKAHALGDLLVLLSYGPIIILGSYYVMTKQFSASLLFISFHFSLITVSVLHANNLRDIKNDRAAGVRTFASILGIKKSIIYYKITIYLSYGIILISVLLARLPLWSLLCLLTLPVASRNIKTISSANRSHAEITTLDKESAQLQLFNGLILIFSLILALIF